MSSDEACGAKRMIVKAPTPGSVLGAEAVSKPSSLFSLITMPAISPACNRMAIAAALAD